MFSSKLRIGLVLGGTTCALAHAARRRGQTTWRHQQRPCRAETLPEDLRELLRPLRRQRLRAEVVLAAPQSYLRSLQVRVATAKQIPDAVKEQLPKLLPFDLERAQVQFVVQRQEAREGQLECLLSVAACEREALQRSLEALWRCGWAPTQVMPSALALVGTARALHALTTEATLIVEIGERCTTLVVVDGDQAVYARDVNIGDEHLTDALTAPVAVGGETLTLSREDARTLTRTVGVGAAVGVGATFGVGAASSGPVQVMPMATYQALLQPVLEQLESEVRRTLAVGAQAQMGCAPRRVLISGAGATWPQCDQWLSQRLGLPVTRLECAPLLGASGSSQALACGLVGGKPSASPDLLPPAWRRRAHLVRAMALTSRVLIWLVCAIWIVAGWQYVRHRALVQQLGPIRAQWADLQPVLTLSQNVEAHATLIQQLATGHGFPADWLRRLAKEFPGPARLTSLGVSRERNVSLAGETQEREQSAEAQVSELALWLERAGVCRGVQLGASRRVSPASSLAQFEMTCQLQP